MHLKEKKIIVTGGSGLIGQAIMDNLWNKGAIPINIDITETPESKADFIACDVTDRNEIKETIAKIVNNYGKIDGLVNNAYPRTKDFGSNFETLNFESWDTNMNWQLGSYAYFCQQVIPYMQKMGKGSIINIASIYGVVGNDFTIYDGTGINPSATYSAIKGGLINFSRHLASKYGKENIRINCVSPGGIFDHQPERFVKAYEHKVPMKRMGTPSDIAPAVSFLLSDEAAYITGQNLIVDGGWTAI